MLKEYQDLGNERLEEIIWKFCNRYCKHPGRMMKQGELDFRCRHCPMHDLIEYVDELRGKSST